jgi:ribosomal protein L35
MKTNKAITKRLRVTRNGKVLSRTPGHNHFNAKSRRSKQLNKKGVTPISFAKAIIKKGY